MPDAITRFLIFFSTGHPYRALVAGLLLGWLGMAIYYIATRRQSAGVPLKIAGIAIALYGGAHGYSVIMVLAHGGAA